MSMPQLTTDELKASLRKSFTRTLITEGRDDYSLFRSLNIKIGFDDIFPAGNRHSVLSVAKDHTSYTCPNIAYLVDRDLWSISGVPDDILNLANLTITDGYSIENDLLRDVNVEGLIYESDLDDFRRELELVIRWFCAGSQIRLSGREFDFDRKISYILPFRGDAFTEAARNDVDSINTDSQLLDLVKSDYPRLLRGKTYLSLITRYLNYSGRLICHNPMAILESGVRGSGPLLANITNSISGYLA